ncbi:serine hydrolase [Brunnivagina elsteri]|uniref:Serine hydrolase n=1 Tax=Brunnivagina elsteri CCALA 953 TaxID=987040 RepID=A0A2A2TQL0_9CYAN|nr:serine hydrolase [Calothrix elsteri]PAX60715.1 serine hydrolase [Calothrix elsteri CCALA 953]
MKFHWLLPSFITLISLSLPATATNPQVHPKVQQTSKQNYIADLTPQPQNLAIPGIKFIIPIPESKPNSSTINNSVDKNKSLFAGVVPLGKEMSQLKTQVQTLMAKNYKFLAPGMFFLDLESGDYLDINGDKVFPAASTIKYPVLIALFEQVDAGKIKLDETLVLRSSQKAAGSGTLQYQASGIHLSVAETVNKMISISDNTATNMIIDRLGGKEKLNQRFQNWGLQSTVIRNRLGDFKGTNTTSAKDLVRLSALIENHKLISDTSHLQVIEIMRNCHNAKLLAAGVGKGGKIAHKTGDIGFVVGDAGIIEMPNGHRYLAGFFVRRPHDDERGREFVRRVSRMVYEHFDHPVITQK